MASEFSIRIFLRDQITNFTRIWRDRCQLNCVILEDEAIRLTAWSAAYWRKGEKWTNEIDF